MLLALNVVGFYFIKISSLFVLLSTIFTQKLCALGSEKSLMFRLWRGI